MSPADRHEKPSVLNCNVFPKQSDIQNINMILQAFNVLKFPIFTFVNPQKIYKAQYNQSKIQNGVR